MDESREIIALDVTNIIGIACVHCKSDMRTGHL